MLWFNLIKPWVRGTSSRVVSLFLCSLMSPKIKASTKRREYFMWRLCFLIKTSPNREIDASLCPVRALRCYLHRTQASRGQRKRLFLPLGNKPGEITKNSISYWLKSAILRSYDGAGLPAPTWARPHELRAVAASMALHSNISVQNIVQ